MINIDFIFTREIKQTFCAKYVRTFFCVLLLKNCRIISNFFTNYFTLEELAIVSNEQIETIKVNEFF